MRSGLAAAFSMLVLAAGCTAEQSGDPRVSGDNAGYVGVKSGIFQIPANERKPAPELSGRVVGSDATLATSTYADKILVVNVWGSWCGPCREEAAGLQEASKATSSKAQFVGLNTRDYAEGPAAAFQRAQGISYPSIYDPNATQLVKLSSQIPLTAIPSTLIVDDQGRAAVRIIGPITKATLVDLIDDVAAGK